MKTVVFPTDCSLPALAEALEQSRVLSEGGPTVWRIQRDTFVHSGALAFLCTWGANARACGREISLKWDQKSIGYIERMGLFAHLGIEVESGDRRDPTGRFIPLRLITENESVLDCSNAICDLVMHQFEDARAFVPALVWAVYEIVDNILTHGETPVPGAVCAQYFPKRHRLDIGICDVGRGIKKSLESYQKLWSHGDAITKALERGVTRDPEVGQGNGLAGARQIVDLNGGSFQLWTGDAVWKSDAPEHRRFTKIPELPGTGVQLSFDTRKPVNLEDTFIGDADWTFLDVEAERLQEGGVRVREECVHTGGREPAKRLRRKLLSVLPDMEGPLLIDFEGVENAASSFLDELLGRLADELGEATFNERVQVVGLTPRLRSMANVVIAHRLRGLPAEEAES